MWKWGRERTTCLTRSREGRWAPLGLTLVLLSACGGSTLRSPVKTGIEWREYRTPHFVLHTDAPDDDARKTLDRLEASHAALRTFAFPYEPPFDSVSDVTLFAGMKHLGAFGHENFIGFFSTALEDFTGDSSLVLAGAGPRTSRDQIITHELVHRFVEHHLPGTPTWLNEGLAQYYESFSWSGDTLTLGIHPLARMQAEETQGVYYLVRSELEVRSIPDLRRMDAEEFYGSESRANYASAWAAVSALTEGEGRARFATYLDTLHRGETSEAEAFRALAGADEGASLKPRQEELAKDSSYETEKVTFRDVKRPTFDLGAPTLMPPEAVHRLWARLLSGSRPKEALEHANQAVELNPNDPESVFVRAAILWNAAPGSVDALSDFRRAYEGSGRAPRYGAPHGRHEKTGGYC